MPTDLIRRHTNFVGIGVFILCCFVITKCAGKHG